MIEVLIGLYEVLGEEFICLIVFLSSVLGGSVGMFFFFELFEEDGLL